MRSSRESVEFVAVKRFRVRDITVCFWTTEEPCEPFDEQEKLEVLVSPEAVIPHSEMLRLRNIVNMLGELLAEFLMGVGVRRFTVLEDDAIEPDEEEAAKKEGGDCATDGNARDSATGEGHDGSDGNEAKGGTGQEKLKAQENWGGQERWEVQEKLEGQEKLERCGVRNAREGTFENAGLDGESRWERRATLYSASPLRFQLSSCSASRAPCLLVP